MTPAEEMQAAAKLIREKAAKASPGPWSAGEESDGTFYHRYGEFGWYVTGPAGSPELDDSEQARADIDWIALMGPDKADVLADLIDEAGDLAHFAAVMEGGRVRESSLSILERTALKFARAILGAQS